MTDLLVRIDDETYHRAEDAKVSVLDHGFLFGDSVYEVLRTHAGRPYQVGPHLARLFASARRIALDLGRSKERLAEEIHAAVADFQGAGAERYVRLIVTRGVGEIHLHPGGCTSPTRVLIVKPLDPWPARLFAEGITLARVSTVRNAREAVDPAIKTGNYLNNILAIIEARRAGAEEALMVNAAGFITECTTSNLFFAKGGILHTPSLEVGILSGITRSDVLRLARSSGVPVREGSYREDDLADADEVFITSTTRGIMPVKSLDDRAIGDPSSRPLTTRLQGLLQAEVDAFVAEGA